MRYWISPTAMLCALLLSACSTPEFVNTGKPGAAMANPASEYCLASGGHLRIEKTPNGEVGICALPDGRELEEWQLFRHGS